MICHISLIISPNRKIFKIVESSWINIITFLINIYYKNYKYIIIKIYLIKTHIIKIKNKIYNKIILIYKNMYIYNLLYRCRYDNCNI